MAMTGVNADDNVLMFRWCFHSLFFMLLI